MKRIISFCLLASLAVVASTARADTIHLKNGSVIKGKVASFADDQFVVVLDTGSSRYLSRAMIFIGDVARIEFDSAPAGGTESGSSRDTSSSAREPAPIVIAPTERDNSSSRSTKPSGGQPRDAGSTPPATSSTASESQPGSSREPAREPESSTTTAPATTEVPEVAPPSKKPSGPVKTVNVDVAAKREWTSTGVIVKRGDRIRITASGTVTLDPTAQQTSGPEGTELTDSRKLMTDRPTGALIGVIGADNDDFIFIGRSAEFTATRDGLLFLSVNEGALSDNSGAFKASIEVQSLSGKRP